MVLSADEKEQIRGKKSFFNYTSVTQKGKEGNTGAACPEAWREPTSGIQMGERCCDAGYYAASASGGNLRRYD